MRNINLENNPTLQQRFWKHVKKTPTCWLWQGSIKQDGYGQMYAKDVSGRTLTSVLPHRISWLLHRGQLPLDKEIMHKCDVRNCVRTDHLQVGTHQENMQDCAQKSRIVSREIQTHCKNGHLYTLNTFYRNRFGWRFCRPCRQATRRRGLPQRRIHCRKRYALLKSQGLTPREAMLKR